MARAVGVASVARAPSKAARARPVAVHALALHAADADVADHRQTAPVLAAVHLREVHLHRRQAGHLGASRIAHE